MRHHKVPGGMKRRVLRWYDYSWSRGRIQGGGDINTALGLLPDKLKTELALHVNLSVLKKVTIFQECQPEFLHDLVLKMKAYIFTPGDSICRKGEVAREMFIIADGILEVLSETGKVLTTMKAGDFFGEIGILNLDGLNKYTKEAFKFSDRIKIQRSVYLIVPNTNKEYGYTITYCQQQQHEQ
uniref:Cyclic nucleotide-binding domain-containing protein n=1 Tax=Glossina palpalis gambiensis TaxID=67801 RepID=A0A1B0BM64_9MUSC